LPELYSFLAKREITVNQAKSMMDLYDIFQLPMTLEAFQQYNSLWEEIDFLEITQEIDNWIYIWGTSQFSVHKAYIALYGHMVTHPVFNQLWASKCQAKHRVFFWLLMQDKLNTRGRLQVRHMALDSYILKNASCKVWRQLITSS
jgi:hypothetical protein